MSSLSCVVFVVVMYSVLKYFTCKIILLVFTSNATKKRKKRILLYIKKQYTVALIILYRHTYRHKRLLPFIVWVSIHTDLEHHCVIDPHWNLVLFEEATVVVIRWWLVKFLHLINGQLSRNNVEETWFGWFLGEKVSKKNH